MMSMPPPSGVLNELFIGAAVRERYRSEDLLGDWLREEADAPPDLLRLAISAASDLEEEGREAIAPDGSAALELPEETRLGILQSAGVDRVREALRGHWRRTLTEESCLGLIEGRVPDLNSADRPHLAALAAAIPWARAAGASLPLAEQEVARAIARLDFRESIGGPDLDKFVGRKTQLHTLRQIWRAPAASRPTALIKGAGGVGKSLLLAKFADSLLSTNEPIERPSAVFHFDYERYELQSARPSTILGEMARQASRWCAPSDADGLLEFARARESVGLDSVSQLSRHSEAAGGSDVALAHELLERLWRTDGRPVQRILILSDTVEQVDGFDDVARASIREAADLLRQLNGDVMEIYASRSFREPAALAGRRSVTMLPLGKLMQREALAYLRSEAAKLGISLSRELAHEAQRRLPPVPLALRLAVALLGDPREFDPERWIGDLATSRGRVQAMLYERVLDRIRYAEVRKVAKPGLLLRRLTAPIIAKVLARPCGLQLGLAEAERVMRLAREEGQLFTVDPSDSEAVWHRRDVRRLMFHDLRAEIDPSVAEEIHCNAVCFYENNEDPSSRAEELYHRLQLGQAPEILDERWTEPAGRRLKDALLELPQAGAAYLRARLGGASLDDLIDFRSIEYASLAAPDRQLEEVRLLARRRLQSGDRNLGDLFEAAGFMPSATTPLGDIYVEWLILSGRGNEAVLAAQDLRRSGARVGGDVRGAVYASAAAFLEGAGRLEEALEFWSLAVRNGSASPENVLLGYEVGRMRVLRKLRRGLNTRERRVRSALVRLRRTYNIVFDQSVTAREAVAELAEVLVRRDDTEAGMLQRLASHLLETDRMFVHDDPELRDATVRLFGWRMGTPSRRELNALVLKLLHSGEPGDLEPVIESFRQQVDASLRQARELAFRR